MSVLLAWCCVVGVVGLALIWLSNVISQVRSDRKLSLVLENKN